jgi:hypothetical protein
MSTPLSTATPMNLSFGPLDGPRVVDLLDAPRGDRPPVRATTGPASVAAGSAATQDQRAAQRVLGGAAPKQDAGMSKDLAGTKPASAPITISSSSQVVSSDAGWSLRETVTFTKPLGPDTKAELSIGARFRDSSIPGKPSHIQPRVQLGVNHTVLKNERFEFKVGASVYTEFTKNLEGGKSPLKTEYGIGVQASAKVNITKNLDAQLKAGVTQLWTTPGDQSATEPRIEGRLTFKPPKSKAEFYAGGVAEWSFSNSGKSSSASSLFLGASFPVSKNGQIFIQVNHSLDGNDSSYPSSSGFMRNKDTTGFIFGFNTKF